MRYFSYPRHFQSTLAPGTVKGYNTFRNVLINFEKDINQRLKDWLAGEYNQRTIDIKGIDLKKKKPTIFRKTTYL